MLLVPVHLDALVLDSAQMVVEAVADFRRLPYCDGTQDLNPDVANISEEIVSQPFQNRNLPLNAGIHLHWSLPDALARSRHTSDGQDFPPAPNRWLITRCNAAGNVEKEWLVESDYLHPADKDLSDTTVTVPFRRGEPRPYRYMGRSFELSDGAKNPPGEYYPKLTAVGYGEPTFAAFYPNCHSVFGFYDPDLSAKSEGRRYYLIGWYSDPAKDFLGTFVKSLRPEVRTNEARKRALEQDFKWTLSVTEGQGFPVQMLCYASLELGKEESLKVDETVTVAVGNTGTEALSAYLAERISHQSKTKIEDQLEALQLSHKLEHRQLDVGAKFIESRHEKGFTAIPGGTLWSVRPEPKATSAADAGKADPEITLPPEIAPLLNTANDRQQEYDRAWREVESLRRQLFSDWYKYMLCAYPPDDARDAYPNIDEVESFIDKKVKALNQRVGEIGTASFKKDENGRIAASVDSPGAAAENLKKAINDLQTEMDKHLKDAAYRLKQVPGPRYWRPNEPVVLIAGPSAKPSERHGQDGRASDGLLETEIPGNPDLTNSDPTKIVVDSAFRLKVRETIAEIGNRPSKPFAFSTWTGQPWNPFLLEWEVEVFPVENKSNLNPATGSYASDFVADNYVVNENAVDLSIQEKRGATTPAANVYSGRSILTPHAGILLKNEIADYLNRGVLPPYFDLNKIPLANQRTYLDDHDVEPIKTWYEQTHASSLNTDENKAGDTAYTAIQAYATLKSLNCLSQSLGGFNEALLMHKQTMQLRIGDPLGFEDYQSFAASVSKAVNDSIYSAPEPLNDFNPIRSGAMKILQLRLVDTFGQIKDLDIKDVIMSEPMANSDDAFPVRLAPRLVQPARINFRWLAADSDEQEMNDHPATTPVCGWLLTSNLDNSVMIYDGGGKALGSLVMKDSDPSRPSWEPAPGGGPDAVNRIDGIKNQHLKKMAANIQKYGAAFLKDFTSAVDSAMENIEPENFAQHQDIALLMGRPVALVRASLNLELEGLPAYHQGWNEFRQDLQRDTRDDNAFSEVLFPIRLGEYKQFNDGTVGYWKDQKGDGYEGDTFYAPQSDDGAEETDSHLKNRIADPKTHKTDPMTIFQSVKKEPQLLSILMDPRGLVQATSGILPAKAVRIPPDQYADALQNIEITFLSAPILTGVGKMNLPLPVEAGYKWSWLQQNAPGSWTEVSTIGPVDPSARFSGPQEIREGWLKLSMDNGNPAGSTSATVTNSRR
jgi:hypothetical protein